MDLFFCVWWCVCLCVVGYIVFLKCYISLIWLMVVMMLLVILLLFVVIVL